MKTKLIALAVTLGIAAPLAVPVASHATTAQLATESAQTYQKNHCSYGFGWLCSQWNWEYPTCVGTGVNVAGRTQFNCSGETQEVYAVFIQHKICTVNEGFDPFRTRTYANHSCG